MSGERGPGRKLGRADVVAEGGITCHNSKVNTGASRLVVGRLTYRGQQTKSLHHRWKGRDAQREGEVECRRLDCMLTKHYQRTTEAALLTIGVLDLISPRAAESCTICQS